MKEEERRFHFYKGKEEAFTEILEFLIISEDEFETYEQTFAGLKGYAMAKKEDIGTSPLEFWKNLEEKK